MSVILHHVVCPAKYRRVVFTGEVDEVSKDICLEILKRYEIWFIEIGVDDDAIFSYNQFRCIVPQELLGGLLCEIFYGVPPVKEVLWGG